MTWLLVQWCKGSSLGRVLVFVVATEYNKIKRGKKRKKENISYLILSNIINDFGLLENSHGG